MLTARGAEEDVLAGLPLRRRRLRHQAVLGVGADGARSRRSCAAPGARCTPPRRAVRVRRLARRSGDAHRVARRRDDRVVTRARSTLLALFARERGRIVSRRRLLVEVWGMRARRAHRDAHRRHAHRQAAQEDRGARAGARSRPCAAKATASSGEPMRRFRLLFLRLRRGAARRRWRCSSQRAHAQRRARAARCATRPSPSASSTRWSARSPSCSRARRSGRSASTVTTTFRRGRRRARCALAARRPAEPSVRRRLLPDRSRRTHRDAAASASRTGDRRRARAVRQRAGTDGRRRTSATARAAGARIGRRRRRSCRARPSRSATTAPAGEGAGEPARPRSSVSAFDALRALNKGVEQRAARQTKTELEYARRSSRAPQAPRRTAPPAPSDGAGECGRRGARPRSNEPRRARDRTDDRPGASTRAT